MCGIAYISKLTPENLDAFMLLCYEMQDRGEDGFGFTDGSRVWRWDKTFTSMWKGTKSILESLLGQDVSIIAHTRAASVGAVSVDNSHPFRVIDPEDNTRTVIGVHNGGISNYAALNTQYNRAFEVDSQHIFAHLAESKPTDDLNGYGTVVWNEIIQRRALVKFDYFVKFNGGSISVAQYQDVSDSNIIILASTEDPIVKVCEVMGVEPTFYNIKDEQRYEIKNGVLYIDGEMKFGQKFKAQNSHIQDRQIHSYEGTYEEYTYGSPYMGHYSGDTVYSSGQTPGKQDRFTRGLCMLCSSSSITKPQVVCQLCVDKAIKELPLLQWKA